MDGTQKGIVQGPFFFFMYLLLISIQINENQLNKGTWSYLRHLKVMVTYCMPGPMGGHYHPTPTLNEKGAQTTRTQTGATGPAEEIPRE